MLRQYFSSFLLLVLCSSTYADEIAEKGVAFLETHCAACHGDDNAYPGLDMRDRSTLLEPLDDEAPYLVPGEVDRSRIWAVVNDHDPSQMPPDDQDQPTKREIADLKAWIEAGAEFPEADRPQRTFIGEKNRCINCVAGLGITPPKSTTLCQIFFPAARMEQPPGHR